MPRPSPSTSARSPSARRRWGPITPMSDSRSTTSPSSNIRKAGTPRPSRSTSAPSPSRKRRSAPTTRRWPPSSTIWRELYRPQGRYAEAEPLYKRSLAIREKALGPDHPDVGTALNNLALLHHTQGRYAEAEPLYKRSLAIREKALGPDHPYVAQSLNNLGELYRPQGRYAQAEPLFKRSLSIKRRRWGPTTPTWPSRSTTSASSITRKADTPRPSRSTSARSPSRKRRSEPTTRNIAVSLTQSGRALPEAGPDGGRRAAVRGRQGYPRRPTSRS